MMSSDQLRFLRDIAGARDDADRMSIDLPSATPKTSWSALAMSTSSEVTSGSELFIAACDGVTRAPGVSDDVCAGDRDGTNAVRMTQHVATARTNTEIIERNLSRG